MEANSILQIPLTDTTSDDIISWQGTKDGQYTVKSGYHAQMEWNLATTPHGQTSSNQHNTLIWNKLWKIQSPPKQLHLLWRIINNALPTKTNLTNKRILNEPLCPRCSNAAETIDHAFLHYEWAAQVWFCSPLTITTSNSQINSFVEWLEYMIMHTQPETTQLIATITYCIWLARNNLIYNNKSIPAIEAVHQATQNLHDFKLHSTIARLPATSPKPPSVICNSNSWSPPPVHSLKLNVDAHLTNDGRWALGWVMRRSDGSCAGAGTKVLKGYDDAAMAEATGIFEALKWVESQQLNSIIFESDAANIVKALQTRSIPRNQWGQIARKCVRILDTNPNFSIQWVQRNGNSVAHTLARWALVEPDKTWQNIGPSCIWTHTQKDMGFVNPPS
jgi:ribonuclease HI